MHMYLGSVSAFWMLESVSKWLLSSFVLFVCLFLKEVQRPNVA